MKAFHSAKQIYGVDFKFLFYLCVIIKNRIKIKYKSNTI